MKRGDLVITVLSGDYGKPRPAVLVQSEALFDVESLLLCPLTTDATTAGPFRLLVMPTPENGLSAPSVIMTDKITAVPRRRCRDRIGRLSDEQLQQLDAGLMLVLGLGD